MFQDEAQKIGGIDPDYHRQDLREAIDHGAYAEYELGVQLVVLEDEFAFDFDILDLAKFWPEKLMPVRERVLGPHTIWVVEYGSLLIVETIWRLFLACVINSHAIRLLLGCYASYYTYDRSSK